MKKSILNNHLLFFMILSLFSCNTLSQGSLQPKKTLLDFTGIAEVLIQENGNIEPMNLHSYFFANEIYRVLFFDTHIDMNIDLDKIVQIIDTIYTNISSNSKIIINFNRSVVTTGVKTFNISVVPDKLHILISSNKP